MGASKRLGKIIDRNGKIFQALFSLSRSAWHFTGSDERRNAFDERSQESNLYRFLPNLNLNGSNRNWDRPDLNRAHPNRGSARSNTRRTGSDLNLNDSNLNLNDSNTCWNESYTVGTIPTPVGTDQI